MEMISEIDAIQRLSDWFKQYGWVVYQDKKNNFNNPVFHVKGTSRKKLDIIVKKLITIGIEVKSGENSRDLSTYSDLITYFENYNEKKTFYFNEHGTKIPINFFVIGTYYSLEGHLTPYEHKHIDSPRGSKKSGWTRLDAVDHGCCPKIEYETTFNITRHGIWFSIDNDKHRIYDTGIGTLLSTCLDNNGCRPAIHIKRPRQVSREKRYWRTQWIAF